MPELQRARAAREKSLKTVKDESMSRFMKDLTLDREKNPAAAAADRWDPAEEEEEDEVEDDLDVNIIDRSACPTLLCPFYHARAPTLTFGVAGEDAWPGQYIDVTHMRPRNDEGMAWPRPG